MMVDRVCIVGSGNWGSAIATVVGRNCQRLDIFEDRVNMWVYEEMIDVNDDNDNTPTSARSSTRSANTTTTRSRKEKLTSIINRST
ncbi:MAG: hypothetical protein HC906_04485 [Bacteroidales bacterium]|nr:hypothetical protein [Bacteroidales bacterium]